MNIEYLALSQFRNYQELSVDLQESRRIAVIGDNAQGKSNFLESLYLLAFASSFRQQKPAELIRWNETSAQIVARCRHQRGDELSLAFEVRSNGKRLVQVNHHYQKRLHDFVGRLKIVLFSQHDLQLIMGPPARRRLYIDLLLVQLRPAYYPLLHTYNRILQQRNTLLREAKHVGGTRLAEKTEALELWDTQLSLMASKIILHRREVLEALISQVQAAHQAISGTHEELRAEYRTLQTDSSPAGILQQLSTRRRQDILRGQTSVGPHRDDIVFHLNGRELKQVGSQGQIRTTALAMKVGELRYALAQLGEYPVLLLDDVFSELDMKRQEALIAQIIDPNLQFFLTTTHLTGPVATLFQAGRESTLFHVTAGQLVRS